MGGEGHTTVLNVKYPLVWFGKISPYSCLCASHLGPHFLYPQKTMAWLFNLSAVIVLLNRGNQSHLIYNYWHENSVLTPSSCYKGAKECLYNANFCQEIFQKKRYCSEETIFVKGKTQYKNLLKTDEETNRLGQFFFCRGLWVLRCNSSLKI